MATSACEHGTPSDMECTACLAKSNLLLDTDYPNTRELKGMPIPEECQQLNMETMFSQLQYAKDCYYTTDSILTKLNELLLDRVITKDDRRVGFNTITGDELLKILSSQILLDGEKRNQWEKKFEETWVARKN